MASIPGEQQASEIPEVEVEAEAQRLQPFSSVDALRYLKKSQSGPLVAPRQFDRSDACMELRRLHRGRVVQNDFFVRLLSRTLPKIEIIRGVFALPPNRQLVTTPVDVRICQYLHLVYAMQMQQDSAKLYAHLKKGRSLTRMLLQVGIEDEDGDASSRLLSMRQMQTLNRKYANYMALKRARNKNADSGDSAGSRRLPVPDELHCYYMIHSYFSALLQANPEYMQHRIERATSMFKGYVASTSVTRTTFSHRSFVRWVRRNDSFTWLPIGQ